MENKNDGGPAFPIGKKNEYPEGQCGMSLRDYFAAKAMQGLMNINEEFKNDFDRSSDINEDEYSMSCDILTKYSYNIADAMLKQKEVKND